jgi:predicted outer membrane repeat protein
VTQRSIRRGQLRRAASQQRRAALRLRRATLAAGAALGATALFAPGADAATFTVTDTSDPGDGVCDVTCSLRDAVTTANDNGEDDTITFASGVTGTIHLGAAGPLYFGHSSGSAYEALTIQGPGADVLALSGDGVARIVDATDRHGDLTLTGLTLTDGSAARGGAIDAELRGTLTIADSVISGNAGSQRGGALYTRVPTDISRSLLSGNSASADGGAIAAGEGIFNSYPTVAVVDSTISGNTAEGDGGAIYSGTHVAVTGSQISGNSAGNGGGIATSKDLRVEASTISGNVATGDGGGIARAGGKYGSLDVLDSRISGNSASHGGGLSFNRSAAADYGARNAISGTTISGNDATTSGAGLFLGTLEPSGQLAIARSTIAGNDAGSGTGGGMTIAGPIDGDLDVLDSTISGNSAATGAGATVLDDATFDNSTIAANTAPSGAGGVFIGPPGEGDAARVGLNSTIVADNAQDDIAGGSPGGGFHLTFSLVERPGGAPLTQAADAPSLIGQDPQLGPLADNGGPTQTHLPARTSPAIEQGHGELGTTDQRGQPRVVDNNSPNALNGDGTDIGAVELDKPPNDPMPPRSTPPQPPPPRNPQPARDLPPQAVIKHNGLRSRKASRRFATGVASDDHLVAAVDVALVRKRRGKCRHLLPSGRFSKAARCQGPRLFQLAEGTTKWRFALSERLDRGYYVLYSRAVDDSGRKQISFGTKSRRPFRVR